MRDVRSDTRTPSSVRQQSVAAFGSGIKAIVAQHGIAVDRCAREIVGFLKAFPGALAATECYTVGPHLLPVSPANV